MSQLSRKRTGHGLRLASLGVALLALFSGDTLANVPEASGDDEEAALPLPRWTDEEMKAFRASAAHLRSVGGLGPDAEPSVSDITTLLHTPIPSGPRVEHSFGGQDSELSSRLRPEDMRLFLPESVLGRPVFETQTVEGRIPTPLASLREVSREFLAACSQVAPDEHLIDPEMLVPEMQGDNMRRFLDFHARDARIKLHILIVATDAKLPEGAELGNVASGSLRQNNACLLVYPLSEPWRTRLFVSKSVHDLTSPAFLSETIQACVQEAMQVSDSHDQLHRYAVHLSTRLFWLQKALAAGLGSVPHQESLAEVQTKRAPEAATVGSFHPRIGWAFASLAAGGFLALTARRLRHWVKSRRTHRVWMLPEPDTVPRLGGAFTGGGGAIIRYG